MDYWLPILVMSIPDGWIVYYIFGIPVQEGQA